MSSLKSSSPTLPKFSVKLRLTSRPAYKFCLMRLKERTPLSNCKFSGEVVPILAEKVRCASAASHTSISPAPESPSVFSIIVSFIVTPSFQFCILALKVRVLSWTKPSSKKEWGPFGNDLQLSLAFDLPLMINNEYNLIDSQHHHSKFFRSLSHPMQKLCSLSKEYFAKVESKLLVTPSSSLRKILIFEYKFSGRVYISGPLYSLLLQSYSLCSLMCSQLGAKVILPIQYPSVTIACRVMVLKLPNFVTHIVTSFISFSIYSFYYPSKSVGALMFASNLTSWSSTRFHNSIRVSSFFSFHP